MKPEPLTPLRIRNIKPPPEGRVEIADGAAPGLCLRVSAHDTWKWTLRMRGPDGGLRRFVLGDFTDSQGLAWARRQAEKVRQQVRHEGRDPHRERKERTAAAAAEAARDRLTFKVLVEDWQRRRLSNRRPRYAAEAVRALRVAFPKEWEKPADDLDAAGVAGVLAGLTRRRATGNGEATVGHAIASRTAAYGRACFAWGIKHQLVQSNPFAAVPTDDFRTEARDRVLTDGELVAVWRAAEANGGSFGRLVQLLILTGQRREEAAGLSWPEVSNDRLTWTISRVAHQERQGASGAAVGIGAGSVADGAPTGRTRHRVGLPRPNRDSVQRVVEVQGAAGPGFRRHQLAHPRPAPHAGDWVAAAGNSARSNRGRAQPCLR